MQVIDFLVKWVPVLLTVAWAAHAFGVVVASVTPNKADDAFMAKVENFLKRVALYLGGLGTGTKKLTGIGTSPGKQ